jgi:hypothetical protein
VCTIGLASASRRKRSFEHWELADLPLEQRGLSGSRGVSPGVEIEFREPKKALSRRKESELPRGRLRHPKAPHGGRKGRAASATPGAAPGATRWGGGGGPGRQGGRHIRGPSAPEKLSGQLGPAAFTAVSWCRRRDERAICRSARATAISSRPATTAIASSTQPTRRRRKPGNDHEPEP